MERKKYQIPVEQPTVVSEPVASYLSGINSAPSVSVRHSKSDFDEEWNRSLSVEEFRCQCKDILREMYANV